MRVRSDDRGHAPVEPAGERDLLARRLRVDVDEDERRLARRPSSTRSSMTSNIEVAGCRKSDPRTLTTARRAPFAVGTTARPRPGDARRDVRRADDAVGARRGTGRSPCAPERVVAERDRVGARRRGAGPARRGVIPTPSAAFSPFTTQTSISSSSRSAGRRASSASRPGAPTTSAMKRMRRAGTLESWP